MKPSIIYISPGPVYRPESSSYQKEFILLSAEFNGYLFTTSSSRKELQIGGFQYKSIRSSGGLISSLVFSTFCLCEALNLRMKGEQVALVDAYDPIKTGLIAYFVSKIVGAKLAVQVNGVYTSSEEWVDDADKFSTKLKKNLYPKLMQFVLHRAKGIKLLFDTQIDALKVDSNKKIVRNYPCFVDTEEFLSEYEEKENKEILFAGFPFRRKGVDVLISAFKQLSNQYPEWTLKILGWFPNQDELQTSIGGHPRIHHMQAVHRDEMPEQIRGCAILVLASRSEAMGRVLVEAMAASKPRIGSNVDGIPTVINDGIDGLLVNPGDVEDLTLKLGQLMSDPTLRKKFGMNGRQRALKEFSSAAYCSNVTAFYKEVIAS